MLIQFSQRPIFVRRKSLHVGIPLVNACQCHGFVTKIRIAPMEQTSQLAVSLFKWFYTMYEVVCVYACTVCVYFGCILLQSLLLNTLNGRFHYFQLLKYIHFNCVERPRNMKRTRIQWNSKMGETKTDYITKISKYNKCKLRAYSDSFRLSAINL